MAQPIGIIGKPEKRAGLVRLPRKVEKSLDLKSKKRKRPLVSAKAVILFDTNVLLLKDRLGRWDLPGGKLDRGETVLTALRREVWEETGLKVRADKLLTTHMRTRKRSRDVFITTFLCHLDKKPPKGLVRLSYEHRACLLLDIREVRDLKIADRHLEALLSAEQLLFNKVAKAA